MRKFRSMKNRSPENLKPGILKNTAPHKTALKRYNITQNNNNNYLKHNSYYKAVKGHNNISCNSSNNNGNNPVEGGQDRQEKGSQLEKMLATEYKARDEEDEEEGDGMRRHVDELERIFQKHVSLLRTSRGILV